MNMVHKYNPASIHKLGIFEVNKSSVYIVNMMNTVRHFEAILSVCEYMHC